MRKIWQPFPSSIKKPSGFILGLPEDHFMLPEGLYAAQMAQSGNFRIVPVAAYHHHIFMAQLQQSLNG